MKYAMMETKGKKSKTENRPKIPDSELFALLGNLEIVFSVHATERLNERNILNKWVVWMLKGKTSKRFRYPRSDQYEDGMWKYRIHGTDVAGKMLGVAVAIEDFVIVVTAFYLDGENNV